MWGKQSTFENIPLRLKVADPLSGCEPYQIGLSNRPTAFLVNGLNKCPLSNLIHNAQSKAAQALFIVNHETTDVSQIALPDHIPGVHIHVLLLNKADGDKLIDIAEDVSGRDAVVNINFIEYARRNNKISLEVTYSPDDTVSNNLFAAIYESPFTQDISEGNLAVERKYTMFHCSACEEKGYSMAKEDCLSGGRYCMTSSRSSDISGEVMLIQTLKNKCTETILENANRRSAIWEYYWTFNKSCIREFSPKCSNAILKKLGVKDAVFNCIRNSFVKTALNGTTDLKITLQDNELLRKEKEDFNKIQHYSNFPMVKLNNMIFYGQTSFNEVMGFICMHLRDNLNGCKLFQVSKEVKYSTGNAVYRWIAFIFVGVIIAFLVETCRKALRRKMEGELSFQIDKKISNFLERSGGADL